MKVFLVHGWSVQETTTYGALHLQLARYGYQLHNIYLGRYVTLDNEVEIKDISTALHNALKRDENLGRLPWKEPFHIITHSTGALVVKHWIVNHYKGESARYKPLRNLVFLAGPHFGSRLAHHGRTMLAHVKYLGDTGSKVLNALELGSEFSWDTNGQWLDRGHWIAKGIRPFNLIGDRVIKSIFGRSLFLPKIFPAAYEEGSDMVVRLPAANLNFRRYELNGISGKIRKVGEISSIPFGALKDYVHSGEEGIMRSITRKADIEKPKYLNLNLILRCLGVDSQAKYKTVADELARITGETRKKRKPYAQIDFRFKDETGAPINDYSLGLGEIKDGKFKATDLFAHKHINYINPNHFTLFLDMKKFKRQQTYCINFNAESGTDLFSYVPDPLEVKMKGAILTNIITADQTTQIDVILGRKSGENLFVFHKGDDEDLHVRWDRRGEITKRKLSID